MSWTVQIIRNVWEKDPAAKEVHALLDEAEKAFVDVLRKHPQTPAVSHSGASQAQVTHISGHTDPAPAEPAAPESPPASPTP